MTDQTVPIMEHLLKYREVAKLLGVTERTVSTLVKRDGLPAIHMGGSVRFDPTDVRVWLDRSKQQAPHRNGGES